MNTGNIMFGIIGEDQRMACDVISAAVNLSSRCESLTKFYGVDILCTEFSMKNCKSHIVAREIDEVCVLGFKTPVILFQLLGRTYDVTDETLELKSRYEAARKLYVAQDFQSAKVEFDALWAQWQDKASYIFSERCSNFIANPPPQDWTGIWVFDHK